MKKIAILIFSVLIFNSCTIPNHINNPRYENVSVIYYRCFWNPPTYFNFNYYNLYRYHTVYNVVQYETTMRYRRNYNSNTTIPIRVIRENKNNRGTSTVYYTRPQIRNRTLNNTEIVPVRSRTNEQYTNPSKRTPVRNIETPVSGNVGNRQTPRNTIKR